jgi:elongation factor P hydroxylase
MTKKKLKVSEINDITRQLQILEKNKVAFADFPFNLAIANLYGQCKLISEEYDKAIMGSVNEFKKMGTPVEQEKIDALLEKKHEIDVPEITEANLKKTGDPLPMSVLSVLGKFIEPESK